ncbi:MAG: methyltransferase [Chloroflexota bacterium]
MNRKKALTFRFKQFAIQQERSAFKVGTDGILLGAWATVAGAKQALDIGTGTGLLALMLAQRNVDLQIDAVELDAASSVQAAENVASSPWGERIQVRQTAVQAFTPTYTYDLIITNPPFYPAEQHSLAPNKARRQARQTTTLPYAVLLENVARLLGANGRFCLILPTETGHWFVAQAEEWGLRCVRETAVRPTPSKEAHRLLLELGWGKGEMAKRPFKSTSLTIETERRHYYTKEFKALTGDFYLNLDR